MCVLTSPSPRQHRFFSTLPSTKPAVHGYTVGEFGSAYPIEEHTDRPPSINRRLLAAQLADLAQNPHGLVRELLEVGRGDAGCCF